MKKNITLFWGLSLLYFIFFPSSAFAAVGVVQNFSSSAISIPKYDKVEFTFDLNKSYPNPYYFYDATDTAANNPANMSWFGIDGVSIDLNLTTPSGKSIKVPAFWIEDYSRINNSNVEILGRKANGVWKIRFTPSEVGTYQYFITNQDKDGTGRFPSTGTQSFTVTDSSKKGFIHTSATDSRFMEYQNGSSYIPISAGRQWSHADDRGSRSYGWENIFNTFGQNKINLVRIWDHADFDLAIEEANPQWIRQGVTLPGGALGTEIGTANVHSGLRSAKPSNGQGWYQRIAITEPNKPHKLTAWIKTSGVSSTSSVQIKTGTLFNSGTLLSQLPSVSGDTNWTQYSVTFTPNSQVASINLIYTGTTGAIYVDDISVGPTDTSGNIQYNIISDADFERHFGKDIPGNDPNSTPTLQRPLGNYINQWTAFTMDKVIESAETNGIAIQMCSCSGPWMTWPVNQDQLDYSQPWVLKSWERNFRYRVARWGYSTSVLAWEKHNEHGNVEPGNTSSNNLINFYKNYGQYQKSIDPYGHLRTTSQGSQNFSGYLWTTGATAQSTGGFDLANYHDYMMSSRYPATLTNDEANFVSRFAWCLSDSMNGPVSSYCSGLGFSTNQNLNYWTGPKMPWVWGEIDVGTTIWNEPNPATKTGEGRLRFLHNITWTGLFTPLGTTGLDWYWDNEDTATKNTKYAQKKIAAIFFENIDYDGANFTFLTTQSDTPTNYSGETIASNNQTARVFGMRRANKKAAYLWIQNRNHTWFNAPSIPSAISPIITINNLLNESYNIAVWNTYTGTVISNTQQTPSNGSINIPISNLTDDVAVKIESTTASPTPTTPVSSPTPTVILSPTPTPLNRPCSLLGDTNSCDGVVNALDFTYLSSKFGTNDPKADLKQDGIINVLDYSILSANFGKTL